MPHRKQLVVSWAPHPDVLAFDPPLEVVGRRAELKQQQPRHPEPDSEPNHEVAESRLNQASLDRTAAANPRGKIAMVGDTLTAVYCASSTKAAIRFWITCRPRYPFLRKPRDGLSRKSARAPFSDRADIVDPQARFPDDAEDQVSDELTILQQQLRPRRSVRRPSFPGLEVGLNLFRDPSLQLLPCHPSPPYGTLQHPLVTRSVRYISRSMGGETTRRGCQFHVIGMHHDPALELLVAAGAVGDGRNCIRFREGGPKP